MFLVDSWKLGSRSVKLDIMLLDSILITLISKDGFTLGSKTVIKIQNQVILLVKRKIVDSRSLQLDAGMRHAIIKWY